MSEGNRARKQRLEKEHALELLAEKRLVITKKSDPGGFDATVRVDGLTSVEKYRVGPETCQALIDAGAPIAEETDD